MTQGRGVRGWTRRERSDWCLDSRMGRILSVGLALAFASFASLVCLFVCLFWLFVVSLRALVWRCQVMRLGFRSDESVYTSVRGRQERPRGRPMAHMDCTNIYDPYRVRVIRF